MFRGLFFSALLFALPLQAVEPVLRPASRPANGPRTIGEAVGRARERVAAQADRSRASVIYIDTLFDSFIIPIAGNVAGAFGTHFRSDLTIVNSRTTVQRIAMGWIAAGRDSTEEPLLYFNLPADSVSVQRDVVGTVLNKTGLGTILVVGVDAAGELDGEATLDGESRIWTFQPNSAGSVSQGFPAVALFDLVGPVDATIVGLRQDSSFRTNVGVVNLDQEPHTFTARSLATGAVTTISLPAYSMNQVSLAAGSANSAGDVALVITTDSEALWSSYAGSTDNITGDGWVGRAKAKF